MQIIRSRRKILIKEQKSFALLHRRREGYNDANDVEHFNPNLKDTKVIITYLNYLI